MKHYYPSEYKILFKLGIPIVVGQLGMTLQGVADTIMVGRHSTEELASVGLVNNIFTLAVLFCVGFTMGAISQFGSNNALGRKLEMVSLLKSSLVANTLQCATVMLIMGAVYIALPYMGQPEELLPLMKPYYLILLFSLPFISLGGAYKQLFDSMGDTWVAMSITLIGNVWNVLFNALLIFGLCGFPEMGLIGAGWATFSSRVLMFLLYVAAYYFMPKYAEYRHLWRDARVKGEYIATLNRLGWPTGIQQGMEAASFSLCAIFLGWIGTAALAAHQVMLNIAMLIFLFYIGIGNAVSIRVSNHYGRHDNDAIRVSATAGYQMILFIGVVACVTVVLLRHHLSALFTDSQAVSDIVATLVWPMVLYQVGDGMQCNYINVLRGLGDVKPVLKYSFIAYIIISLPLSYIFGITMKLGAFGVWMGFPVSLTLAGVLYLRRFRKIIEN
jgi:MATE family multidrug resistance protein